MKVSVSLPDEDVEFLDDYAELRACRHGRPCFIRRYAFFDASS